MVRAVERRWNGSSVVGRALPQYMSAVLALVITIDFIGDVSGRGSDGGARLPADSRRDAGATVQIPG